MKKIFLWLGLVVGCGVLFYFFLISFSHPLGLWRVAILITIGLIGLLTVCGIISILCDTCWQLIAPGMAQRRLHRRLQQYDMKQTKAYVQRLR